MAKHLFLVAYDIADSKRLRRMLKLVKSYACGGQKSVFECWLNQSEREHLLAESKRILVPATDRLLLIGLDPRQRPILLGRAQPVINPWFYYQG
ncbi:MAG: CRISPR-associated endonuclease Cas2 [Zetaproteobacteria bacterium]|nr:MAG: CRISPR-associated endonuclease Cas2 [Zetaproteobacteria bacterium]